MKRYIKGIEIDLTKSKQLQRKISITKNLKKLKVILNLTGNYVMHKNKSKVSVSDQFINDDQQVIKDQHEIVTKFNEYFENIGPNLAKKIQGTHQTFKSHMDHRCPNSVFL